jgi:hypothetical protein
MPALSSTLTPDFGHRRTYDHYFLSHNSDGLQTAGRLFCLPPAYLQVLAEIISSILKMEAICSSETSVATQQTTRRYITEDDTIHPTFILSAQNLCRKVNTFWRVTHMRKPEMNAVSGRTTLKNTSCDLLAGLASLLLTTVLAYRDLIRVSTLRLYISGFGSCGGP